MATTITANGINFPDGSAGSPSIGGSDTNTGLFTGSDIVGFATGGSERLKIDASGNVNIANDSGKLQLGASADLKLYHNGSHSYISSATGNFNIGANNEINILGGTDFAEYMARFIDNGAVELYHNGSKKFETTSAGTRHGDAVKGAYGNDQDLLLYHESGVNYIQTINSTNLEFYAGSDKAIRYEANGAVELYYDNVKKLETTANGVKLIGTQHDFQGVVKFDNMDNSGLDLRWEPSSNSLDFTDNVKAIFGTGSDLQIYHDGSNSYVKDGGTGELRLEADAGGVRIQRSNGHTGLFYNVGGQVELYYDNSKKLSTRSDGIEVHAAEGGEAMLYLTADEGDDSNDKYRFVAQNGGDLVFQRHNGSAYSSELRLKSAGGMQLNFQGSNKFETTSSGVTLTGTTTAQHSSHTHQTITDAGSGTSTFVYRGHHSSGSTISFNVWSNGNVQNLNNSYGSLSDIKLKENIVDANSQWNDIKAIKIRNYNFKAETGQDTHTQIGCIAQEVETVSPKLVYESPDINKDAENLGTTTKSINYSILYMKGLKALQEAMAKIEILETKVAALEAA